MKARLNDIRESLIYLQKSTEVDDVVKIFITNDLKIEWLIEQVELLQKNAQKNGELNEFLQKRNAGKYVGKHVIDAVMGYVKELENNLKEQIASNRELDKINRKWLQQNNRYREALEEIKGATSHNKYWKEIAFKALEGEE